MAQGGQGREHQIVRDPAGSATRSATAPLFFVTPSPRHYVIFSCIIEIARSKEWRRRSPGILITHHTFVEHRAARRGPQITVSNGWKRLPLPRVEITVIRLPVQPVAHALDNISVLGLEILEVRIRPKLRNQPPGTECRPAACRSRRWRRAHFSSGTTPPHGATSRRRGPEASCGR